MKLEKKKDDYSKFSYSDKDQFFTPLKYRILFQKTKDILDILSKRLVSLENYIFIEPSAGNGVFLNQFPKDRRIGLDIEPRNKEIVSQDYLEWTPSTNKKYIVIGNPPFGLRGQLALKFINHSYEFADYVCFILPQLFESDEIRFSTKKSKGVSPYS